MTTSSAGQSSQGEEKNVILETKNLKKEFGGLVAVDGVDIQINTGEIRCLIGPNGAGKSTFLKMIVGQHSPTAGQIFFKDEDITDLRGHQRAQRGLSMKFQVPAVYGDLSVRENMHLPLQKQASRMTIETTITDILDQFGLQAEAETKANNLSHGQQQWLEIGMAAALEPDLLLLDEPAAGMSIEETKKTAKQIQMLSQQGITLLVIEHDIDFVRSIADYVTVLHQGRVFAEGAIEEIENNEEVKEIYLGQE